MKVEYEADTTMARKNQEFDPLGGPIGGSGDGPGKKKKSKGRSFDVLGGGFEGQHTVEKESFSSYSDRSSSDTSDALMETGADSSPNPEQKKKKGLLASIFGGKKKKPQPQKELPLESEEAPPPSYVPKHVRDPDLEIQDGIMETGIIEREEYEERPHRHKPRAAAPAEEEDLFEEGDTPPVPRPKRTTPAPAAVERVAPPPTPGKSPARETAHLCCLCGSASETELPQFEPGVPLCRTCYRAVSTLMKFRDPKDEQEIKSEWFALCPSLDSDRADEVIAHGRRNS